MRAMHRPGTADLSTALAFSRAASNKDWEGMLALARTLDDQADDRLGVILYLALVAGHALNSTHATADELLDGLAEAEREHA